MVKTQSLICLGNPLLDIIATADEQFLRKYDLEANNAILAAEKHKPLYDELVNAYEVDYIAGGAAQNTARIVENVLGVPKAVVYMGSVGRDLFSDILGKKAMEDGVDVRYQYTTKQPTGTCAVVLTNNGKCRSLCANLAAATCFTIDHIKTSENAKIIEKADYFYVTGYFLIVSPDTALELAKTAADKNKLFILNLSAPYICRSFNEHLRPLLPYVDIMFCNETEAEAFSEVYNLGTKDLEKIAEKIVTMPISNKERKRLVIITHGENPVIVANDSVVKQFHVPPISPDKIIDTNGAGDAFVGGFIAQLMKDMPFDTCVKCGCWAAAQVIQQSGCIFKTTEEFKPES